LSNINLVRLSEKPAGFTTWNVAIKEVMNARASNMLPEDVDEYVWGAFETMAFVLMPHISP
jgi:hypothetical protein